MKGHTGMKGHTENEEQLNFRSIAICNGEL